QELWQERCTAECLPGDCRGRVPHHSWRERLGKDHPAENHSGLRKRECGRTVDGRGTAGPAASVPAPREYGIPELRAVPSPDGRRERRIRFACGEAARCGDCFARGGSSRQGENDGICEVE